MKVKVYVWSGGGGIYTTTADMTRFWRAFLAGRIVGNDWVAEMTRPHSLVPAKEGRRYGLGFGSTKPALR